ncbi:hypothetical protein V1523DRAFT_405830 [Lipomyces doorenjongii]
MRASLTLCVFTSVRSLDTAAQLLKCMRQLDCAVGQRLLGSLALCPYGTSPTSMHLWCKCSDFGSRVLTLELNARRQTCAWTTIANTRHRSHMSYLSSLELANVC